MTGSFFLWILLPSPFPTFDTYLSLIWGRELFHGHLPDYDFWFVSTPHPLSILFALSISVFKGHAYQIILATSLIIFSALLWTVFQIGKLVFNWQTGMLAVVLVATQWHIESYAVRAYNDLPFVLLVMYAVLLEIRKPKRGIAVLIFLGLAGLLRPEAWVISAVYFIYIAWRVPWKERLIFGALAVSAPVLWMLFDFMATGDLLYSLHRTGTNAVHLYAKSSIAITKNVGQNLFEKITKPIIYLGVLPGAAFALMYRRRLSSPLFAVALINLALFALFALLHLPLEGRYLLIAIVVLTLLCSAAVFSYVGMPSGKNRSVWASIGVVTALLILVQAPFSTERLIDKERAVGLESEANADIQSFIRKPGIQKIIQNCKPMQTPTHRPVPLLRYWFDLPANAVVPHIERKPNSGLIVTGSSNFVRNILIGKSVEKGVSQVSVPSRFKLVAKNRSWALFASPNCQP